MEPQTASGRDDRGGHRRTARPAGRPDRRRQDPGGLPAQSDRIGRARAAAGHRPRLGHPHHLHLAAQGPDHRRRTQPDDAHPRDRAEHPCREPDGGYEAVQEAAPARLPARHPPDHAGAAGPVLRLGRRAGLFRRPQMHRAGRGPRHLERQARRPAGARDRAVAAVRPGDAAGGPVGDHRRPGFDQRLAPPSLPFSPCGRRCPEGADEGSHRPVRGRHVPRLFSTTRPLIRLASRATFSRKGRRASPDEAAHDRRRQLPRAGSLWGKRCNCCSTPSSRGPSASSSGCRSAIR